MSSIPKKIDIIHFFATRYVAHTRTQMQALLREALSLDLNQKPGGKHVW